MRCKARLYFVLFLSCVLAVLTYAENQPSRQLPQVQPGVPYAAQLAIPPGLGYPFEECKLAGDPLPKGLIFDCDRLQLKGQVSEKQEKTYALHLLLADAQRNEKSFVLLLRVSSRPTVVNLGDAPEANTTARDNSVVSSVRGEIGPDLKALNKPISAEKALPDKETASMAYSSPGAVIEDSRNANDLQAAMVQLIRTSLATKPARNNNLPASKTIKSKHAFFSNINLICDEIPNADNAVTADASAQSKLMKLIACPDPKKADQDSNCAQYTVSLRSIEDEAKGASSKLKSCVTLDNSLSTIAKSWYLARAAAWDALVVDINAHQHEVATKTYLPGAELSQPLIGDPLTAVAVGAGNSPQNSWVKEQIGVGSRVISQSAADYSNNSNVLSKNGTGMQAPVFLLGAAFQMPQFDRHFSFHKLGSSKGNRLSGVAPTSIFTNLQFSPNSTNVLNGYTFGFGYRLGGKESPLDFLVGYSVSPFNEPSAGFRIAASQVVTKNAESQKPLPVYLRYDAAKILDFKDYPDALDGFPVLTQNPDGTQGSPIYSGNVLTTHYRGGIFLGLSFSYDLLELFQPKQTGSTPTPH